MSRQIYTSIRDTIRAGRLAPRSRIPPSRSLASDLGVSRTTVVLAYEQLEAEGYIAGRRSQGSFVKDLPIGRPKPRDRVSDEIDPARESAMKRIASLARQSTGLGHLSAAPVPFRIGEPALDLFPSRLWARLVAKHTRRSAASLLGSGAGGHMPLRAAIASYVGAARGVNASADQVIITRGTHQALHLTARVVLGPDELVWVEDPGYLAARTLFQVAGASIVPVPVDRDGIIVAHGIEHAPHARLAYVAPSHQFPLGVTMSLARRLSLLEWATRSRAWIVEDDYDSEFRYTGSPIASLQGLDTTGRVIYVGTFSQTMFPALRLGYMIVPASLIDVFLAAQTLLDPVTPNSEQLAMAEFIDRGHFARHVRHMRSEYADRQRALLAGVSRELSGVLEATPTDTGMHVIGWLNPAADDVAVSQRAWRAGVEAAPLSAYRIAATLPRGLLLGFAAIRPAVMDPALGLLRRAIAARTDRSGS
jgi:GntR family transcriptional regulator/MocR family aminotransferase